MLAARDYYSAWWKTAFPGAWATARSVSTMTTIVGGLSTFLVPGLDGTRALAAWMIPLAVLLLIAVPRLIRAPYDIFVQQA